MRHLFIQLIVNEQHSNTYVEDQFFLSPMKIIWVRVAFYFKYIEKSF